MRSLLFALVALAGTLTAGDPPVIASQLIDATTSFNWHEDGTRSIATLDVETMTVTLSMVVSQPKPPSFTTSYTGTDGVDHSVTTTATSNSVGAIVNAIKAHQIAVAAMQDIFPPAQPNGSGIYIGKLLQFQSLRLVA